MTSLGNETPEFKMYVSIRDEIMASESLSDLNIAKQKINKAESLLKVDQRNVLHNVYNIRLDELNGVEPNVVTTPGGPVIPAKTHAPVEAQSSDKQDEPTSITPPPMTTPTQSTSAVEIDLTKNTPSVVTATSPVASPFKRPAPVVATQPTTETPASVPVDPNVARVQADYTDIDKENFAKDFPTQPASLTPVVIETLTSFPISTETTTSETPTETTKRKRRTKAELEEVSTYQTTTERAPMIKITRRINTNINNIAYTNNEYGFEVVAETREEAIAMATLLRDDAIADIKAVNLISAGKPVETVTPPAPVIKNDGPPDIDTAKELEIVIKKADDLKKEKEVLQKNYDRLVLFLKTVKETGVEVKFEDGTGMLIDGFIDGLSNEFSKTNPKHTL